MSELYRQIEGLKLKGMSPIYRDLLEHATAGNLQYEEYLALLLKMSSKGSQKTP